MTVAPISQPRIYNQNTVTGLGSTNLSEAELFQLMLQQNINSMLSSTDNFFGSQEEENNSIFGSSSSLFGSSDLASTGSSTPSSPILEMIGKSKLIGKTVEALDPSTGTLISGKIKSVYYEGNLIFFDVEGHKIPPENLRRISE